MDPASQLLCRCALRDMQAFDALYQQTSGRLFALALKMLKQPEWAEEVLQDAYVRIWQHAGSYKPETSAAMTWMTTILRNRALDKLREAKRNPLQQLDDGTDVEQSERLVTQLQFDATGYAPQDTDKLKGCLGKLDEQQQESILLSYYYGYSHGEIAKKISAPLGTVKSWIRRALEHLRECMG